MKTQKKDQTSYLPDGTLFAFWEKETTYTKELHVNASDPKADDAGPGSKEIPFKTIQAAANQATPSTHVLIHGGTYRECVRPAFGGTDPEHMVCYEAYGDGEVVIKASEIVNEFEKSSGWILGGYPGEKQDIHFEVFELKLSPKLFQGYQPFGMVNILHDRLFIEYEKTDMTPYLNRRGMIFCDGKPLTQVPLYRNLSDQENSYFVEANGQTVHFRLKDGEDPKNHVIEVTCREQCFAPDKPFLPYIKVKGLTFAHAAGGAPVPQRGALSCYRGHHWIIEDCVIDWSNGVGIDVGNECWHHEPIKGQIIGHSVIRRCVIKDAGVCGIAGLFAEHMLMEDNLIEGTGWQKMELSWEAGAIKLHNSIDGLIRRNIFRNTFRADHIWLDCGNENNRITNNLFLDGIEQREAIFIECTRDGINLIDHNVIWNVEGRFDPAKIPNEPGSTGWYKMTEHDVVNGYGIYGEGTDHLRIVANLFGKCRSAGYFSKPVAFREHALERGGTSRDARIVANLFYECGEAAIKFPTPDNRSEGNFYVKELGGYLRILHPEPEVCLHLPAWKEFYGLDLLGKEGWFDIEVDRDELALKLSKSSTQIPGFERDIERRNFVQNPELLEGLSKEKLSEVVGIDDQVEDMEFLFYDQAGVGSYIPGPFEKLEMGAEILLDPRKLDEAIGCSS